MEIPGVNDLINLGFSLYGYWKQKKKAKKMNMFRNSLSRMIAASFTVNPDNTLTIKENILENMFAGLKLNITLNEIYAVFLHSKPVENTSTRLYKLKGLKSEAHLFTLDNQVQSWISEFLFQPRLQTTQGSDTPMKYIPKQDLQIQFENLKGTEFKKFFETNIFSMRPYKYSFSESDCRAEYLFIPPLIENEFFAELRKALQVFLIRLYQDSEIQHALKTKIRDYFTQVFKQKLLEIQLEFIKPTLSKNLNIFLHYIDHLPENDFAFWWVLYFDANSDFYRQPFIDMKW